MTTDTVVPVQYNPYDYQIHEDPYPTYARLREEAPLYRNDDLDFWALSRHEDVLTAFRNPAQLSNRFGVSLDPAAYGPDAHRAMSFLALDPPTTPACALSSPRPSRRGGWPSWRTVSGSWPSNTSRPPSNAPASISWLTSPAFSPWT